MNINDLGTQLLFTTVPIWAEMANGSISSGTAFIYSVSDQNNVRQTIPLLITSLHVIKGAKRCLVEVVEAKADKPDTEKKLRIEIPRDFLEMFTDEHLDTAAIPLGPTLNGALEQNKQVFFRAVSPEMIAPDTVFSELAAIEEIVFIGYPSGVRDEKNSLPIVRRGITATPVWNDFDGKPVFLIDAGVFPGSSGSPVFIFNQGSFATPSGLTVGNRLFFLGMVRGTLTRLEQMNDKTFLGLGEVLHAGRIRDFAQSAISRLLRVQNKS